MLRLSEIYNASIPELLGMEGQSFHFEQCESAIGKQEGTYTYNALPKEVIQLIKDLSEALHKITGDGKIQGK